MSITHKSEFGVCDLLENMVEDRVVSIEWPSQQDHAVDIQLPTYAFERQSHWVASKKHKKTKATTSSSIGLQVAIEEG